MWSTVKTMIKNEKISVTTHLCPKDLRRLRRAAKDNKRSVAGEIEYRITREWVLLRSKN
jgi:hypothetical protein